MSAAPEPPPIPTARVERERRLSWAWLLPLAALAFAAWLVADAWGARGPLVRVRVREGRGIQAGDPLRYRGVDVGAIERVRLEPDLSGVELSVRLEPDAAELAREGTRFWLVRPQLSLEGVQGLETILGANYLAVLPGPPGGDPRSAFTALEEPPIRAGAEPGGLRVLLESSQRYGLAPGAPITFRDFQVGTVLSVELASDATVVEVEAWLRPEYAPLVRANTRFWETGGVELDFALTSGLRVEVGSLRSLVVGGVALATPAEPGAPAREGQRFALEDRPPETWREWRPALPVGIDALAAARGAGAPEPLRAELRWRQGRVFRKDRERSGWLLAVPGGLIGPADLLAPVEAARGETRLAVDGEEFVLDEAPLRAGGLARSAQALSAVDPWPQERVAWGAVAGDWAVLADPERGPQPLSAARLRPLEEGWELSGDPAFDASWHGAAVVDRASGDLVGLLVVDEERARVLRPPASFWSAR